MNVISLPVDCVFLTDTLSTSSTSPGQQQIDTYSKSSAAIQQQLQNSPSVNTRPLRCFWKWISRQTRKGRCYCELPKIKTTTITKAIMMPSQEKDAYHLISRPEQVIMVRLRTEHNRLNAHMHKQLNMVLWAACPYGEEDQTKEHILQTCKRHDQKRYAAWPTETTLNQKLHGDEENLRQTTKYILETGKTV